MEDVNWDAVAAVGQCLGALATFIAVVVALNSSRLSYTPKIKVEAQNAVGVGGIREPVLVCSAINVGAAKATITSTGIIIPNKKQLVFPHRTSPSLPASLETSQKVEYMIPLGELSIVLKENGFSGEITLKVFFSDSMGKRHFGRTKFDLSQNWERVVAVV